MIKCVEENLSENHNTVSNENMNISEYAQKQ